eukprot:CAMPEP_0169412152 /NCGR_PEP_ID=MMETSP1017-20121227/60673_1 /TAXON_ID=342587 /ORGANISM="Karlodinium micrum, Strain CCMP2283" /LENGTH=507 /DNA_ID=CAMNT_0009519487 /DNA_START=78 /DNA_END=1598 /DNA_ORIENTATION=+
MASQDTEAKVKQEKPDVQEEVPVTGGNLDPDRVKAEDKDSKIKEESEKKIKSEVKSDSVKGEDVKGESVKGEPSVKRESAFKEESVKGESAKSESTKTESTKNESTKTEHVVKGEMKGETVKGENQLAKSEGAKQEMKAEAKRERSRSPKKKDKKVKKERGDSPGKKKKKEKKDKKRARSGSPGGRHKRKSKWGPDVPTGFSQTSIPGKSGFAAIEGGGGDVMPRFNEEEMKLRTVVLQNLPSYCTGQELIEFFNGAVLAVTANAVQQAANKSQAPVFACTISEEDHGGGDRRKVADLKFRTPDGASVGMKLNGIEYKGKKLQAKRPDGFPIEDGIDPALKLNLHEMSKLDQDLATGKIKGYGIFEYDDPNDVELAVLALNGFVCGQNVIRVQQLGQQQQAGVQPKAQPVAATAMSNSMTQKIVSNPVLAMQVKQGREIGSRPSTVVQLTNAVYQEDLMDDQDYDEIMSEVHNMASKHGPVARVVIPKPNKDGTHVDGVGKMFVSFL